MSDSNTASSTTSTTTTYCNNRNLYLLITAVIGKRHRRIFALSCVLTNTGSDNRDS